MSEDDTEVGNPVASEGSLTTPGVDVDEDIEEQLRQQFTPAQVAALRAVVGGKSSSWSLSRELVNTAPANW